MKNALFVVSFFMTCSILGFATYAFAHCDTMDGPVIQDAQTALETSNAAPILKWVKKEREKEVLRAFDKAIKARKENPKLKEKTNMKFFNILITIHREGEGEHFEGIKPAGTPLEPGIMAAEEAIKSKTAEHLSEEITNNVSQGIHERFNRVMETQKHMDDSIEAGREYVEAYIEFMHYVENVHNSISKATNHQHAQQ